jgi:hypothetical protein
MSDKSQTLNDPFSDAPDESDWSNVPSVFTRDEVKGLADYVAGRVSTPPESFNEALSCIAERLVNGIAGVTSETLVRLITLNAYLQKLESHLFNDLNISTKSDEDLLAEHSQVSKLIQTQMEFVRKFIIQNKENLDTIKPKRDELYDAISALPSGKIQALLEQIKKG